MIKDEIKIWKDSKLMELQGKMANLQAEEGNFLFTEIGTVINGRTMKNVAKDKVSVYEETNAHLREAYPDNKIASYLIAVNKLSSQLAKETFY